MALGERLKQPKVETTAQGTDRDGGARKTPADRAYHDLKARVHARLFEYLDVSKLARVSESRAWEDIAAVTRRVLAEENAPLTHEEREMFVKEIHHEVFGLGPLEPLLQDPTVCDVLVNGPHDVWVERRGKLERTSCRFKDAAHLMRIIERITASVGRRVDESTPMVDARLADGSRVNVIIPPLALDGPTLSIRRFAVDPLTCKDLIECGTLTRGIAALLEAAVSGRLNVLISGGTGVGKTTMLNVLSEFIPDSERIITIEDSAELQLRQEHVVRLETRPASIEGSGRVTQRELLINSLRMRPDRIIVGEVRGGEALDMLQAMNTGHNGSLTTIHANSPRDALSRLETMVAMAGLELSQRAVRQYIASAIEVVIQLVRLPDGSRRLASLQEITGLEGEVVTMQEICKLERRTDEQGRTVAHIVPTGLRPSFERRLRPLGITLPAELFEPRAPERG